MRKNKGFTLIELLIVMAILGILFIITFNSWSVYSHRSKQYNKKAIEIITQEEEMKQSLERRAEELQNNLDPNMKNIPDKGDKKKL